MPAANIGNGRNNIVSIFVLEYPFHSRMGRIAL
jgi:hypothetical protein